MQITITMDLTPENLEKLKAFCEAAPEVKVTAPKAKPKTKEPEASAKVPDEPVLAPQDVPFEEEAPAAPAPEPKSNITKTDVRAVALKISKAGKSAELEKIFDKFGAKKLSEIKEEDYEALMTELADLA